MALIHSYVSIDDEIYLNNCISDSIFIEVFELTYESELSPSDSFGYIADLGMIGKIFHTCHALRQQSSVTFMLVLINPFMHVGLKMILFIFSW